MLSGCVEMVLREPELLRAAPRPSVLPHEVFDRISAGLSPFPGDLHLQQQKRLHLALVEAMTQYRADFAAGKGRSYEAMVDQVIARYVPMIQQAVTADQAREAHANSRPVKYENDTFVVPPGKKVSYTQRGYCMDKTLGVPGRDDALALYPASQRIGADLMPLYKAIGKWGSVEKNSTKAQDFTWALMGAGTDKFSWIPGMEKSRRQLLDSIMPGGADALIAGHKSRASRKAPEFSDYDPIARRARQENKGLYSQGGRGVGHSTLAPGVFARGVGVAPLEGRFEVVNLSGEDFEFSPLDYMAVPLGEIARKQFVSGTADVKKISESAVPMSVVDDAMATLDVAVEAGGELAKYLLEKTWGGAWHLLNESTPAASRAARKALTSKAGGDAAKAIGRLVASTPIIGNGLSIYEFVTGKDFMTGETLGMADRLLAGIGSIPGANTLRAMGHGIQYVSGASSLAKSSGKTVFGLVDDYAPMRDVAGFIISDTAGNLGVPFATFNAESRAAMQQLVVDVGMPWQASTARVIDDLKSGKAVW